MNSIENEIIKAGEELKGNEAKTLSHPMSDGMNLSKAFHSI